VHVYVNAKRILAETTSGNGGREDEGEWLRR
jgi:hypothetical protein